MLRDLVCEFTSRGEYKTEERLGLLHQCLQNGQDESCRLSRTCLGDGQYVASGQMRRDGRDLNRLGFVEQTRTTYNERPIVVFERPRT